MAGQETFLLNGGAGAMPSLVSRPTAGSGGGGSLAGVAAQPHHGAVGLVLIAVLVLLALDMAGFRFAVTAGRR